MLFEKSYLEQFIKNNDVYVRDDYEFNRIILSDDENEIIDDEIRDFMRTTLDKLYGMNRIPAGPFYYYAPLHALSWHTNMESSPEKWSYRMYTISCQEDYVSYFCYRHPLTGLIHIVGDKDKYTNIFYIGEDSQPLWHAVINNSITSKRLSLGFLIYEDDDCISDKQKEILNRKLSLPQGVMGVMGVMGDTPHIMK